MGQRHQVYLRIKTKDFKTKKTETVVVGIHHQWLYGHTALRMLSNMMKFLMVRQADGTMDKDNPFGYALSDVSDAQHILSAAYSIDHERGYFHNVHPLTTEEVVSNSQRNYRPARPGPETLDPRLGDNNDGITVIDITEPTPKIAFVSLYGIECNPAARKGIKSLSPMTPEQYVRAYYPDYDSKTPKDREGKVLSGKDKAEALEHAEYVKGLVAALGKFEVMTKEHLKTIFPAMFKKQLDYRTLEAKILGVTVKQLEAEQKPNG